MINKLRQSMKHIDQLSHSNSQTTLTKQTTANTFDVFKTPNKILVKDEN